MGRDEVQLLFYHVYIGNGFRRIGFAVLQFLFLLFPSENYFAATEDGIKVVICLDICDLYEPHIAHCSHII